MRIPLQKRGNKFLVECTLEELGDAKLLGIVDTGSSFTLVSSKICERAKLKPKGDTDKVMCIHGKSHTKISVPRYRGTIAVGTKSGSGTVYEINVRPVVAGLRADVIVGCDVLQHFRMTLDWVNGTGFLEG